MKGFRLGSYLLPVYAALAFVYLLTPIAYTFAFSFNDAGKSNLVWRGFTWNNWRNPCGAPAVCESVVNSIAVGLLATLVSTVLGTMIAIALVRYRFRFRATTNLLLFLPMATPEVVLGAALLAQFLNLRVNPGFTTIVIAHVMFCISFVVVTVKARVATLDPHLEEAAADLYASPAATQALLDDALVNLDEWLAEECESAFAAQETDAFVNGNGTNKPKGFLAYTKTPDATAPWGDVGYIATGAAGAFAASNPADALLQLVYTPRAEFRPGGRFVMNRRTVSVIRRFKDGDGNYLLQPARELGQTASLLGYPLTEIEAMPDIGANAFAVAFGDFRRGYLIVDRQGVRVLRDPYSAKPYVLFYTTKRVGGGVQNFDAIKLLKFAAS